MQFQDDFDALIPVVAEGLVGFRRLVDRQPMGDNDARIDVGPLVQAEENTQPMFRAWPQYSSYNAG